MHTINLNLYTNSFSWSESLSIRTIEVDKITGELCLKKFITEGNKTISVQSFSDGIYIVKLTDENGVMYTDRLIVQH